MMTCADKIAEQLGGDGTVWKLSDGRSVEDVLAIEAVEICHEARGSADDRVRYEFADGSAIVVMTDGWDVGYPASICDEHDVLRYLWPAAYSNVASALSEVGEDN